MQSNWYVSKNGKAFGPKNDKDISDALRTGELSTKDLIFKEGEKEWKKVSDYPHFAKLVLDLTATPVLSGERPQWILLKKNIEDTQPGVPRFDQEGPFQKDEVLKKIRQGEANWSDYIWRQGFSSWQKLSEVSEFNPDKSVTVQTSADEITQPDFEIDQKAELLAKVDQMESAKPEIPQIFRLEEAPPEAIGENLAKTLLPSSSETVTGINIQEVNDHIELKKESDDVVSIKEPISRKYFSNKRMALYGGTFVLVAIILSVSLFFTDPNSEKGIKRVPQSSDPADVPTQVNTNPAETVTEPAPIQNVQQEVPPAPEIESVPTAGIEKFVKIVPLKLDGNHPQLVFESNADAGESINIKITSKEGQILDQLRFEHTATLARREGEVPSLDLTKLAIPKGSFSVEATIGSTTTNQTIFIGKKNRQFQIQLDKYNKSLTVQKKKEKKEVTAALDQIEKLAAKIEKNYTSLNKNPAAWTKFFQTWSKDVANMKKGWLGKYKVSDKNKYFYPSQIEGSRNLTNDLFKVGKTLNEAVRNRRKPASGADFKGIKKKLKSLRDSF